MFYNALLPYEKEIMDRFIKYKVHQIANTIYKEYNGYIPRIEAPYLIRYFLQFPSQSQVVDEILPAIQRLESSTDKSKDLLEVEAFENYLITILRENTYVGYERETLIEAFRLLDTEGKGYLDLHTFYAFLKRYGITFTNEQIKEMESFLLENSNELLERLKIKEEKLVEHKPTTTRKFYYESYARKVLCDNQAHFDAIYKEYKEFYNIYQETKKFPDMPELPTIKEETAKENNTEKEVTRNDQKKKTTKKGKTKTDEKGGTSESKTNNKNEKTEKSEKSENITSDKKGETEDKKGENNTTSEKKSEKTKTEKSESGKSGK